MDIYLIGIVLFCLIVMITMMTNGYHKGFVHEITSLISLAAAIFVILLIAGIIEGYHSGSASNLAVGLLLVVIFGVIYRLIRMFMGSLNFIARLPVIRWLDSALGLVAGLLEGFALLYILEYLARNFLLA